MSLPHIQRLGIYFSGFFKYDKEVVGAKKLFDQYAYDTYIRDNKKYFEQKYYPNWLHKLYPDERRLKEEGLPDLGHNHFYLKDVGGLNHGLQERGQAFRIGKIEVYLFREELAIFTIKIQPPEGVEWDFKDISTQTRILRDTTLNQNHHTQGEVNPLIEVIEKNVLLHFTQDPMAWLNFNPQLKLFMNIDVQEYFTDEETFDHLLFDLATAAPLGSAGGTQLYSPSPCYYEEIMSRNTIALFGNWKVVCLFDSMVRISINLKEADRFNLWEHDYFAIYIFTAFRRFYLYQTNTKLAELTPDNVVETQKVRNSFIRFMNDFEMTEIAYKFLPNFVYKEMQKAFGVTEEVQKLGMKINRMNSWIEENQHKVMEHQQKAIERRQRTNEAFLAVIIVMEIFTSFHHAKDLYEDNHKNFFILSTVIILIAVSVFLGVRKWGGKA